MNESDLVRFRALIRERLNQITRQDARGRGGQAVVTLEQQAVVNGSWDG